MALGLWILPAIWNKKYMAYDVFGGNSAQYFGKNKNQSECSDLLQDYLAKK